MFDTVTMYEKILTTGTRCALTKEISLTAIWMCVCVCQTVIIYMYFYARRARRLGHAGAMKAVFDGGGRSAVK